MARRTLGRTGLELSPIGFGAFKIGRNVGIKYARPYELPDDAAVDRLLNGVLDLGINLIDTAPAYGTSEEHIGRAISHRRHEFILSTKVGETFEAGTPRYDFSTGAVRACLARSLARLRTDVLDLVLVHSDGHDLGVMRETDVVSALQAARDEGQVRFIGFSGKTVEGTQAALDWADAIMVEYHPMDASHEGVISEAAAGFRGRGRGVGVIVKKPLASGTLAPRDAIPFILQNPNVSSAVVGGLNLDHLRENLELAVRAIA